MKEILTERIFKAGIKSNKVATHNQELPNLEQVQGLISGLKNVKDSVRLTSTANIVLTGLQSIDGVLAAVGDRILVAAQTNAAENGIYIAAEGAWSRAADADENGELQPYTGVFVREGVLHQGHRYVLQSTEAIVIGTTDQTWIHELSVEGSADHISTSSNNFDALSGSNVQEVLDSADDKIHALELVNSTSRYEALAQTLVSGVAKTITHNLDELYPAVISVYDSNKKLITDAVDIISVDANNITIQQDSGDDVVVNVVIRK